VGRRGRRGGRRADAPSFAGVAAALADRGFDAGRIALFPAWSRRAPAPTAASSPARRRGARRRRRALPPGGPRLPLEEVHVGADAAGRPRLGARVFRCGADHGGDGPIRLTFAGLGRYGRERADAARGRADAGDGPRVLGLRRGYLVTADRAD
jgi:hypothetical protein